MVHFKLLLAATLFVTVSAKAFINPFIPFIPWEQLEQSTENPPVYKEIVFGEDVEGAEVLSNYEYNYSYVKERPEISSTYRFPFSTFNINLNEITKILVEVEETNEDMTAEANILGGGVGDKRVNLRVLAKNTQKLHYKVKIYGIKSE